MERKLGMPALIEFDSIEENVLLAQELELSFVELNMNLPYCFPENLPPAILRRLTEETGIRFTMHMPDDLDMASFHREVFQGTLQQCLETVRWAGLAGVELLNFHINPGIYFTMPQHRVWINDKFYDRFESNLVHVFGDVLDVAKGCGVKISVENVCNFHLPFIQRVLSPLTSLPGLHLTWDVGHDAKTGFQEREVLMRYEKALAHMHLHDYDGRTDHQELFSGELDIMGLLAIAQQHDMSVVVEIKTIDSLVRSINALNERSR